MRSRKLKAHLTQIFSNFIILVRLTASMRSKKKAKDAPGVNNLYLVFPPCGRYSRILDNQNDNRGYIPMPQPCPFCSNWGIHSNRNQRGVLQYILPPAPAFVLLKIKLMRVIKVFRNSKYNYLLRRNLNFAGILKSRW